MHVAIASPCWHGESWRADETASETFSGRIKQIGGIEIAAPATPAQTGAYIASQEAKWDAIVKAANIKLE